MTPPSNWTVAATALGSAAVGFATMVALAPGNGGVILGSAIVCFVALVSAASVVDGYGTGAGR